jgi:hypothetical protein
MAYHGMFLHLVDLLDFPKSQRDPINAKPYQGVGIECYPPKSGYPGENLFIT